MKKLLASLFLAVFLAGCSTTKYVPVPPPPPPKVAIPKANPLRLKPVQFKVYTLDGLKKLVADAEAAGIKLTLITLTPTEYKKLTGNIIQFKRYTGEQKAVNKYLITILDARSGTETPKK